MSVSRTRPAHHLARVHKHDAPYSARRGTSPARTNLALFIIAPCALREAYGKGRVSARLTDLEIISAGTGYANKLPIILKHIRLDRRQSEGAFLSMRTLTG